MDADYILEKKVSFQNSTWDPISEELTIKEVLDRVKKNKYAVQIKELRNFLRLGKKLEYDLYKRKLPAVTFCGTFEEKRRREFLKKYNELIVIDIDKLDEIGLIKTKIYFKEDKFVFSYWESPSQNGIKGLVAIKYKNDFNNDDIDIYHKHAFEQLVEYFFNKYNIQLDKSGSDTTRLCFLSCDSSIVIKESVHLFTIDLIERNEIVSRSEKLLKKDKSLKTASKKDLLFNPKDKNNPRDRIKIQSIIKFLSKRKLSITNSYEKWYRVAFAIADTFTYDIGEKYYLRLCKLDGTGHDEIKSKNILINCYENSTSEIKFSTIIFYAKNKGYKKK